MRISDWSSDVCSSDLRHVGRACRRRHSGDRRPARRADGALRVGQDSRPWHPRGDRGDPLWPEPPVAQGRDPQADLVGDLDRQRRAVRGRGARSEEHTSELQSLMRISYAVFCLKKKKTTQQMKENILTEDYNRELI